MNHKRIVGGKETTSLKSMAVRSVIRRKLKDSKPRE